MNAVGGPDDVPADVRARVRGHVERLCFAVHRGDDDLATAALAVVADLVAAGTDDEALAVLGTFHQSAMTELERMESRWRVGPAGEDGPPDTVVDPVWAAEARSLLAHLEQLYAHVEWDMVLDVRLLRAELALDHDLPGETVRLLREAEDWLDEGAEDYGGCARHLLALALNRLDRPAEAVPEFERAAALSRRYERHGALGETLCALGHTLYDLGRREAAVEAFREAAEAYRAAGEPDEEREQWGLASALAADIAADLCDARDLDQAERTALLSLEWAERSGDDEVAAHALVQRSVVAGLRQDGRAMLAALRRLDPTLLSFSRAEEDVRGLLQAFVALGLLGQGDGPGAEAAARRALALLHHDSRVDELAELGQLLHLIVGSVATGRGDYKAAEELFDQLSDVVPHAVSVLRLREPLVKAMARGDRPGAERALQPLLDTVRDDPDHTDSLITALTMKVTLLADRGDLAAARRTLAELESAVAADVAQEARLEISYAPALAMSRALVLLAGGDVSAGVGVVMTCRDRLLEAGSRWSAATLAMTCAMIEAWPPGRGSPTAALPPFLANLQQLYQLPSSAEREPLRGQLTTMAEVLATLLHGRGETRLLTELLETIRSQSVPLVDDSQEGPGAGLIPIAELLDLARRSAAGDAPADPARRPEWAEQVSRLAPPPVVVMPWGPAFGPALDQANPYLPPETPAPRYVRLTILR